jgi:hypothetical protein
LLKRLPTIGNSSGLFGKSIYLRQSNNAGRAFSALCYCICLYHFLFPGFFKNAIAVQTQNNNGVFIWPVINLIVVPASCIGSQLFDLANAIINMLILSVCIGIPLSFAASSYYKTTATN